MTSRPTDLRASVVRTLTPLLVSGLLAVAARFGLEGDADDLSELLGVLGALAYYVAVRYLETHRSSRFGWLLGSARTPVYVNPPAQITDEEGVRLLEEPEAGDDRYLVEAAEHHPPVAPSSVPSGRRAPRERRGRRSDSGQVRLPQLMGIALALLLLSWLLIVAFAR